MATWIRGNMFIPDARCWWVKPSVKYLKEYLKEHPVDAIISTGPPHSMHLIAMQLKEDLGIPWIADFRDPWTEIDFYDDLHLTRWADRKHHRLEYEVLTKADKVVTIGWDSARELGRLGKRNVRVIPNGYDWDLSQQNTSEQLSKEFTITHLGVITPSRNTPRLDQSVVQNLEADGLTENTELVPYIPHDEVLKAQRSSQVLLLLINNTPNAKGILTGKLFEYLASGRPILCIGPEDGDAARVIKETQAGQTIDFKDKEQMKEALRSLFQKYREDGLPYNTSKEVEKYSRKDLAAEYGRLLDRIED